MTKTEIKSLIKDEINRFVKNELDNKMKETLKSSSSKSREELMDTIKNSMEAVYKILWQKRDFWKKDIK